VCRCFYVFLLQLCCSSTASSAAFFCCLSELQGLQGLQGVGSGYVLETLAAGRKGQEELAGAVREVRGGVEEVRNKVDRLLERAAARES
jgi:hypothetical protein